MRPPSATIDHDVIYKTSDEEPGCELTASSGRIPEDLRGTLLRNGPGAFSIGPDPLHFFDGYGMVGGLSFRDGKAYYRARFVKSPLYLSEQAAGRQLKRRAFANLPSRWKNLFDIDLGNAVMHDAIGFGGRLHATDDGGHYRLDPRTLETIGEDRWEGRVGKMEKMCPVPHVDRKTDRILGYKMRQTPFAPDVVTFYELDRDWKLQREIAHPLVHSFGLCHELAFTEHWYVLIEMPVKLDLKSALWGQRPAFDCLVPVPGARRIAHLVPRDPAGGGKALSVELPGDGVAQFHVGNAFEEEGAVVIDATSYAWATFDYLAPPALRARLPSPAKVGPISTFRRARIDLTSKTAVEHDLAEKVELPRVNSAYHGRPYRYAYLLGANPEDASPDPFVWATCVVRLDVANGSRETWNAGPSRFPSQPAFAARPGAVDEDDGYLIVPITDASGGGRSDVVILDARAIAKGPIATIPLSGYLGPASHCRFAPDISLFPSA
jgi:all-trans-8'-apo-beta-carotenal 15,15'-oxygenase